MGTLFRKYWHTELFFVPVCKKAYQAGEEKEKLKSSLIFDELPTIALNHMDSLIATARSNKVSITLGIQDFSQLRKDYGKEQADVIINMPGIIIGGQVFGTQPNSFPNGLGKSFRLALAFH